jgi:hypothetical protein
MSKPFKLTEKELKLLRLPIKAELMTFEDRKRKY